MRLALGTDWDVAPLNPMLTLYAATTRATLDGKNPKGWFPEQKLTIKEAIEAYTMGSAYAEFQENEKGSIIAGKLADMVLLSDDVLSIDPVKIRDVKVLKTWVGGKLTYDAGRRESVSDCERKCCERKSSRSGRAHLRHRRSSIELCRRACPWAAARAAAWTRAALASISAGDSRAEPALAYLRA